MKIYRVMGHLRTPNRDDSKEKKCRGLAASTGNCADAPNQYDRVRDTRLTPNGLSEAQVQIAWLEAPKGAPSGLLPDPMADAYKLEVWYGESVRAARQRWPNLKQFFVSCMTYTGYTNTQDNHFLPEPFAYESGFSVKWLVEAQIIQRRTGVVDPIAGDLLSNGAPYVDWGPYLWGSGDSNPPGSQAISWLSSDFNADGVHPARGGVTKVANALVNFLLNSPYTPWFVVH